MSPSNFGIFHCRQCYLCFGVDVFAAFYKSATWWRSESVFQNTKTWFLLLYDVYKLLVHILSMTDKHKVVNPFWFFTKYVILTYSFERSDTFPVSEFRGNRLQQPPAWKVTFCKSSCGCGKDTVFPRWCHLPSHREEMRVWCDFWCWPGWPVQHRQ